MDQFVCVRIVQGWGMDLSLFQFDYRLTWAMMFLNADRTVYGRYSSRPTNNRRDIDRDVTIQGLKRALEGALEIHKGYPGNRKELAGKTGPAARWRTPEEIPFLKGKPGTIQADGIRHGCIHCHTVLDGERRSLKAAGEGEPAQLRWPHPAPDLLGLSLDPAERATVKSIQPRSAAERAGFQPGDRVLRLEGQPIISIADIQWILHNTGESGTLEAEIDRGGKKVEADLTLPPGWRR